MPCQPALCPSIWSLGIPLPLLAFVDHANVNLGASTALRTHPRDVPRRVVVVDHYVAVILWPQAALLAAAPTDVLFEVREPALNEVQNLPPFRCPSGARGLQSHGSGRARRIACRRPALLRRGPSREKDPTPPPSSRTPRQVSGESSSPGGRRGRNGRHRPPLSRRW